VLLGLPGASGVESGVRGKVQWSQENTRCSCHEVPVLGPAVLLAAILEAMTGGCPLGARRAGSRKLWKISCDNVDRLTANASELLPAFLELEDDTVDDDALRLGPARSRLRR
jgi:hypothetical protein